MKKHFVLLIVFLTILVYFVWNSSWHLPSQLIIKGNVQLPAEVRVNWDSGSGFNDMESADVVFGSPTKVSVNGDVIKIRRIGKRHPAARTGDVWIKAIGRPEDGRPMPLAPFVSQQGVDLTADGLLHLVADGVVLTVPAGREYTAIIFAMNADSGSVEIDVDGDKRLYDLYAERPQDRWVKRSKNIFAAGGFTAIVNLPRYDINRLQIKTSDGLQQFRITAVTILSQKGTVDLPVQGEGNLSEIVFPDVPRNTKQFFHPGHFVQQVGFAALCTYLLMCLWRFVRLRGGIRQLLIGEKRIFFWLMVSGALLCFSSWLLAYWPGHLTTDSVHIWWAARKPGFFLHEHPFVNIIYYRFLQQFWNHVAVVGVFQIVATSVMGSYIFYHLYKKGLPIIIIIPFYLWFITSVPIGLYNITLWKDIPFALLVVFWAYYFVRLRMNKLNDRDQQHRMGLFALLLLLLCVSLFRYNGIIYLILIPIGLVYFQHIAVKKIMVVFLVVVMIVLAGIISTSMMAGHDYVAGMTKKYAVQLRNTNIFKNISNVAKQYPHILDDRNKYTWYRDDGVVMWHNAFTKEKKYNDFVQYYDYKPMSDALYAFLDGLMRSSHKQSYTWLTWNPFHLLYLFLLGIFYRWFPLVSAYGYILLTQAFFLLMFLSIMHGSPDFDWRYNYYLYLAGMFLIPLIMLDVKESGKDIRRKLKWFIMSRI